MDLNKILIVIGIAIVLWAVLIYNRLIAFKNRAKEAWSDIEVQLKRRYDLIPNLVETIKGYATHEREVFEKVTQARANAMGAKGLKEKGEAENALSQTLKSLFAVAENYPNLRASENFQKFQDELTDTEDKIQAARRFYNGNVRDMNIQIETFPANIIAAFFRFKKMEFFETGAPEEKEAVKVKF
ncbi:MAG: LemA family protein [Candidatus Nealsonbacteria bacterium]|nr:LemA family protein [Candidatus Nealsonbacteria bacterium]